MRSNITFVSRWFSRNEVERGELEALLLEGDLLEFHRHSYQHWAVCVRAKSGPILVAHRISNSGWSSSVVSSFRLNKSLRNDVGNIVVDELLNVLGNGSVRINNERDRLKPPKSPNQIVLRAKKAAAVNVMMGHYNLIRNNCEHFANWCRYGDWTSLQVVKAVENTLTGSTLIAGLSAVVVIASRLLKHI